MSLGGFDTSGMLRAVIECLMLQKPYFVHIFFLFSSFVSYMCYLESLLLFLNFCLVLLINVDCMIDLWSLGSRNRETVDIWCKV